jgi:hypothetical protein
VIGKFAIRSWGDRLLEPTCFRLVELGQSIIRCNMIKQYQQPLALHLGCICFDIRLGLCPPLTVAEQSQWPGMRSANIDWKFMFG